jgi:hypothetical protein
LHQRGDLGLTRHIGSDERRLAASLFDERSDILAFSFASPGENDLRPLEAKRNGRGATNAAGCSGDERDFAFQLEIHSEAKVRALSQRFSDSRPR